MVRTKDGTSVIEARLLPRVWTILLSDPGPYTVLADGLPLDGAALAEAGDGLWRLSVDLPEVGGPLALTLLADGGGPPIATDVVGAAPADGVTDSPDLAAQVAALRAELAVMRAALRTLARGATTERRGDP